MMPNYAKNFVYKRTHIDTDSEIHINFKNRNKVFCDVDKHEDFNRDNMVDVSVFGESNIELKRGWLAALGKGVSISNKYTKLIKKFTNAESMVNDSPNRIILIKKSLIKSQYDELENSFFRGSISGFNSSSEGKLIRKVKGEMSKTGKTAHILIGPYHSI